MPRLWDQSVETHRRAVQDAVLDATAALVARHGPASVTMAGIASEAGIGRATLYKYFSDVDAILLAWHERHVAAHLAHLVAARDTAGDRAGQLAAVLRALAGISHRRPDGDVAAKLHRTEHVSDASRQLRDLLEGVLGAAAARGEIRRDVPVDELAIYCRHALEGAVSMGSPDAVERLVRTTLSGLGADG